MREKYAELDIKNKLVRNFRDIGHTLRHTSEGRGSQKRILIILREVEKITQSELTERLRIQPGSASEVVGKLEAAGLIVRTQNEMDRRTTDVSLTDAGKVAAQEAWEQREKRHNQMFVCLNDEEKNTLLGLLEKVNAAWEQQNAHMVSHHRSGRGHHKHHRHGEE